jgi:hypothetical protein
MTAPKSIPVKEFARLLKVAEKCIKNGDKAILDITNGFLEEIGYRAIEKNGKAYIEQLPPEMPTFGNSKSGWHIARMKQRDLSGVIEFAGAPTLCGGTPPLDEAQMPHYCRPTCPRCIELWRASKVQP